MKIVRTRFIPFKGFAAMNFFGFLLVRKDYDIKRISDVTINHEKIHTEQMRELGYIPYYILYILEWLIKMILLFSTDKAYKALASEREAYENQADFGYIRGSRKRWKWMKNIFSLKWDYERSY